MIATFPQLLGVVVGERKGSSHRSFLQHHLQIRLYSTCIRPFAAISHKQEAGTTTMLQIGDFLPLLRISNQYSSMNTLGT